MPKQSTIYSGNAVELRPSLKSVIRVTLESLPVIGDVFHRYYIYPRRGVACRGVFATYAEAENTILKSGQSNYDLCNIERSVEDEASRQFTAEYEDYPVLFWLRDLIRPGLHIADLGGSTGGTYYGFADALDLGDDVRWTVAELPAAVERGRKVAELRGKPQLGFTTKLGSDGSPDILLTMGAIQYMPQRLPEILSQLETLPEHVIVHKVPVTEGAAFWTIQGLTITEVPYFIHNRAELVSGIEALGYELVDTCDTLRNIRIPFEQEHDVAHYSGFFFRRTGKH